MAHTATFYILRTDDLNLIQKAVDADASNKNWISLIKKAPGSFNKKLSSLAVEKINYQWSGLAFSILAVFSKEKLSADWTELQYSRLANELSEKTETGIYIFSASDKDLLKLKPNGFFYSIQELDEFAIDFEGHKPANPDIMKNAVTILDETLSKLTQEKIVFLLIQ